MATRKGRHRRVSPSTTRRSPETVLRLVAWLSSQVVIQLVRYLWHEWISGWGEF